MNTTSGLNISETRIIESPEQLSEHLRKASETDTPVIPVGGGTCLATGHPVDHDFLALDVTGYSGVVDYIPTDMTAGFLAGTPVSEVQRILAENGQELPIDLAQDDAGTIGGLIATGFSGPRRYGLGTLKDLLIGCEYVRGDGLVAKAGGMTVKNVSGFEISRMLHGSWGSLAVLTRVNLKVLPKTRADRTLVWRDSSAEEALSRQERLLARFPGAVAIQTVQHGAGWDTSIRFTGRNSAVEDYVAQAVELEGATKTYGSGESIWALDASSPQNPQLVLSVSAEQLTETVTSLISTGAVSNVSASFGTGTVRARINQDVVGADHFANLGSQLWMVEGGNNDWKREIPVWGPEREDRLVMQSVKAQFDPAGILNRSRLFI